MPGHDERMQLAGTQLRLSSRRQVHHHINAAQRTGHNRDSNVIAANS
jgi:hypothetical protein